MSDAGRAADAAAAAATAMPSSKTTLDFLSSQSPFLSRYLFMHSRSFRVFSTAILFDDDTTDLLRCCLPCALSLSRSLYLFLSLSLSAAHWHPLLKLIKPIYKSFDREVAIYLSAREHDYKFTPYAQRPAWAHNSWRRRRYIFSTKRALAAAPATAALIWRLCRVYNGGRRTVWRKTTEQRSEMTTLFYISFCLCCVVLLCCYA